jgi:peptidoglycan hydrolase CwlO-like protein
MKKTVLITVVSLLVLVLAVAMVSAASPANNFPPFAQSRANLTDAQKQELVPLFNQMTDLRKQMFEVQKQVIQKQVSFGNLTQEQADQRITWMQQRIDQGFSGTGIMGRGPGMMRGSGTGPMCEQQ